MVVFPNAKINLGLNIVRKRADGYHDLETVFYPVSIRDALEIIPADDLNRADSGIDLHLSGKQVEGPLASNICVKAYELLKRDFPAIPSVEVHLLKAIPTGAGLGGGSADGSFTLRLLNELFGLNLTPEALERYALALGSDCPFFIRNQPCVATGRGECMIPFALDLSGYALLVVHPGIHVSTAVAFGGVKPTVPSVSVTEILSAGIETWRGRLENDFERTVFTAFPHIGTLKHQLYESGALYASMTGSGSAVFGIYPIDQLPALDFPDGYSVFQQERMHPVI